MKKLFPLGLMSLGLVLMLTLGGTALQAQAKTNAHPAVKQAEKRESIQEERAEKAEKQAGKNPERNEKTRASAKSRAKHLKLGALREKEELHETKEKANDQ